VGEPIQQPVDVDPSENCHVQPEGTATSEREGKKKYVIQLPRKKKTCSYPQGGAQGAQENTGGGGKTEGFWATPRKRTPTSGGGGKKTKHYEAPGKMKTPKLGAAV